MTNSKLRYGLLPSICTFLKVIKSIDMLSNYYGISDLLQNVAYEMF